MRHEAKDRYVRRLLRKRDFVGITEAHVLEGVAVAWSCPSDCRCWFSPGTQRRAGVGLVVKLDFLKQFDAPRREDWIETVPGRAAVLRLRGPAGALDLHIAYFATGTRGLVTPRSTDPTVRTVDADVPDDLDDEEMPDVQDEPAAVGVRRQRAGMRRAMAASMAPQSEVLSIVTGDFNWVVRQEDRVSLATGLPAEDRDADEERDAAATLWRPHGLYELRQDEPTHEQAGC